MSNLKQLKKFIGQRVIFGFDGPRITPELVRLDEEWGLGGYILFKRNLEEFEQLMNLTEDLWALGQGTPPFIAVDQEGGVVSRVPEPFTKFPDMIQMGQVSSVSVAYEVGAVLGRELTATGFNLNFAPVLDLNINPDNPIIGRRAISDDPHKVANLAKAIIRGLHDNSIIACGKHFPGHGDTTQDSHEELAKSKLTLETMRERELIPYRELIQNPPHLDMVMSAHVVYPSVDPDNPATLSRSFLMELLRYELGFKGLAVSDDLEMKAITENMSMEEATIRGLEAGLDVFLVCHTLEEQVTVLETLLKQAESNNFPKHVWERNHRRVRDLKARHFRVMRSVDRGHARELVGNREHQRIARRLREGK